MRRRSVPQLPRLASNLRREGRVHPVFHGKVEAATPAATFMKEKEEGEQEEARSQLLEALERGRESRRSRRSGSASALGGCVPLLEVNPFSGCPGTAEE